MKHLALLLSLILLPTVTNAATPDGKHKLVIIDGRPSHPPRQHEFRAGSLLLQKCLANTPSLTVEVRPGENKQVYFAPGGQAMTKKGGRFNWWGRDPAWTDTLGIRDKFNVEKPHGEWNRMEVVCDGDAVTIILNGYVVNHGTKSNRTEGKIQIQSEGAEIIYRKIEVRPLIK